MPAVFVKMAPFSLEDKLRVQTLREQGLGAKAIRSAYPKKKWPHSTLKKICKHVDSGRSAIERKKGSGRPRTARTAENIEQVELLICSQGENQARTVARERLLQISAFVTLLFTTLQRMTSASLRSNAFQVKC